MNRMIILNFLVVILFIEKIGEFYTSYQKTVVLQPTSCTNKEYENLCIWKKTSVWIFSTWGQQVGENCGDKLNTDDNCQIKRLKKVFKIIKIRIQRYNEKRRFNTNNSNTLSSGRLD